LDGESDGLAARTVIQILVILRLEGMGFLEHAVARGHISLYNAIASDMSLADFSLSQFP
jgi:hypothetical protein